MSGVFELALMAGPRCMRRKTATIGDSGMQRRLLLRHDGGTDKVHGTLERVSGTPVRQTFEAQGAIAVAHKITALTFLVTVCRLRT